MMIIFLNKNNYSNINNMKNSLLKEIIYKRYAKLGNNLLLLLFAL